MRLGLIIAVLGLAACSAQAERNAPGDEVTAGIAATESTPAEEAHPTPIAEPPAPEAAASVEPAEIAPPPGDVAIINDHLESEVVVAAALERLAFATVAALTAGPEAEAVGPELQWFPALGLVSAMERRVAYGRPSVSEAVSRTGDADRPFQISLVVPCQITTRSGDGVAVAGTMPVVETAARDVLPRSTTASNLGTVPEHLREAASRAIAACQERDAGTETIMVEVTLVYDRRGETFVLP